MFFPNSQTQIKAIKKPKRSFRKFPKLMNACQMKVNGNNMTLLVVHQDLLGVVAIHFLKVALVEEVGISNPV